MIAHCKESLFNQPYHQFYAVRHTFHDHSFQPVLFAPLRPLIISGTKLTKAWHGLLCLCGSALVYLVVFHFNTESQLVHVKKKKSTMQLSGALTSESNHLRIALSPEVTYRVANSDMRIRFYFTSCLSCICFLKQFLFNLNYQLKFKHHKITKQTFPIICILKLLVFPQTNTIIKAIKIYFKINLMM